MSGYSQNNQGQDILASQYAVLGAMAKGGAFVISEIERIGLTDAHFSEAPLSLAFRVITRVAAESNRPDAPCDKPLLRRSIAQEMRDLGIGTSADEMVRAIYENAASGSYALSHGRIVRDAATFRLAKATLSGLHADADVFDGDAAEFVSEAQRRLLALSDGVGTEKPVAVADLMPGYWERMKAEYNSPTGLRGLDTGYPSLNRIIRGFCPGHLIIVAAESGGGKSVLAGNFASNVAKSRPNRPGKPVCMFSLEMEQDELLERWVFSEARVSQERFTEKQLSDRDWQELARASTELAGSRIRLYDASTITVGGISTLCRHAKWMNECDLVIVDYAQLVAPNPTTGRRSSESREREVNQIILGLKHLAGELKVPVIALSQLNDDGKMRESRAILQHANVVMVLEREDATKDENAGVEDFLNYNLVIKKNRHGRQMAIPMKFFPSYTRFDEESYIHG